MIHVAVYETGSKSLQMKALLENEYSNLLIQNGGDAVVVDSFVVNSVISNNSSVLSDGATVITISDFCNKYHEGILSAIIIPKEYYMQYNALILELLNNGVDTDNIFNGIRLFKDIEKHEDYLACLITPMLEDSYLSYLEYHVVDHCNLNCKYCTHYSPLVKEPVYTNIESFKADLSRLREFVEDIGIIRILGGEPLLCPNLAEYIKYTRSIYPGSVITVVTNGTLLNRIDDSLINVMKECMAFFHISYYPPLVPKMDDIQRFLVDKKIPFTTSPLINSFNKTQKLTPSNGSEIFYRCFMAACHCLHNGKIASCYAPFTTKYFNQAFNQSLPEDEGLDLHNSELTLEQIKISLILPLHRCDYCYEGESCKWEVVGTNSKLEDWI